MKLDFFFHEFIRHLNFLFLNLPVYILCPFLLEYLSPIYYRGLYINKDLTFVLYIANVFLSLLFSLYCNMVFWLKLRLRNESDFYITEPTLLA